jgi:hypothetical protein
MHTNVLPTVEANSALHHLVRSQQTPTDSLSTPLIQYSQSDITTDKCRATLRQHIKHLKCDTVLHDGKQQWLPERT